MGEAIKSTGNHERVVDMSTYNDHGTRTRSRTRWIVLGGLGIAIVAAVILVLVYTGGGGSGGGGY